MLLKDVRIQDYRSVEDSGVVPIDIDVTCLVGKNESGKTAFLQALHLLNPLNPIKGKKKYDEVMDYPSRKSSAYKKTRETDPATVVTAVFDLEKNELAAVRQEFGPDCLTGTTVTVEAGYYGNKTIGSDSAPGNGMHRYHESDVYNPLDPGSLYTRLQTLGFHRISITSDGTLRFSAHRPHQDDDPHPYTPKRHVSSGAYSGRDKAALDEP